MKWLLYILMLGAVLRVSAQDSAEFSCDSIYDHGSYVVFKGDTFNRLNAEGRKYGMWLKYEEWEIITKTTLLDSNNTTVDTALCAVILYKGQYVDDMQQGIWQYFYYDQSMKLKAQIPYIKAEIVGDVKSFYESGKLKMHGVAKLGKQDITCTDYDENGKLLRNYTRRINDVIKDLTW